MKLRSTLTKSEIDSGFTNGPDTLQHGDLARRLTSLFKNLQHGTVSILDGRWGSGKTTFVQMWLALLKTKGVPTIYFDAFKYDYVDSPYNAIASTFINASIEANKTDDPVYANFLSKAVKVGKAIASVGTKIGIKVATVGIIGASEISQLSDLKDDISDAISDASEEAVKAALERHADSERSFSELRDSLLSLPRLLSSDQSTDGPVPPLIVVIDELDRCRPDFALGIIETLKHFFRSDAIHFVLVTNKSHLALSVSHRYGVGPGSEEYLEKFFDFVINFSVDYDRESLGGIRSFVKHLSSRLMVGVSNDREIEEIILKFCLAYRLTLRQVESLFSAVILAHAAATDREFRPNHLIVFLSVLKVTRPDLYAKARSKDLTFNEAREFLMSGMWGDDAWFSRILTIVQYHLDPDINLDDPKFRPYANFAWGYNLDRLSAFRYLTRSVLDRFGDANTA